jgi:ubiquinone/menaquinone biosynthesis C-methylase UbiE
MNEASRDESERIRRYFARRSWRTWPGGRAYLVAERSRLLARIAKILDRPVQALQICDVGCGSGQDLLYWAELGAEEGNLAGTELSADRAATARGRLPRADIRAVDGFAIPFTDGRFDLTTASLVFSTIKEPALRRNLFHDMWRVTRPGGMIAIYDFRVRNPRNREVVAMTSLRINELYTQAPFARWSAAPFLPALPTALRLPAALRGLAIRILPRTHSVWAWRKPAR